jgi:hypothetical protein
MRRESERADVGREFEGAELGDVRRGVRLVRLARSAAEHPNASFPNMVGSEAELEGAYRLLGNPAVRWDRVLAPHRAETARRAEQAGRVVVVHDTTECTFAHGDPREMGRLATGKPGFLAHTSLVVSADGQRRPLGVAAMEALFRPATKKRACRKEAGSVTTQRADRESLRWEKGVEETEVLLAGCKERVHVADREADSYSMLALLADKGCRFVVRMHHNRAARGVGDEAAAWTKLKELAASAEYCMEREVPLSRRRSATAPRQAKYYPGRKARIARLRFSAARVAIRRPRYFDERLPSSIELNLVHVYEVDVPVGEEPVQWLLATREPVETAEAIAQVVDVYRTRWVIEEFFKALKTGCLYEQRQLETRHALLNALALFAPIACQLLWLRSCAHNAADVPATEVLTEHQLQALRLLHRKPLSAKPSVREALLAIAAIGGHWRSNGEPGWIILQRGLQRVLDTAVGLAAAAGATGRRSIPV